MINQSKSKTVKCDNCGKIIIGKKIKIYDENFNVIKGIFHCEKCYCKNIMK